MEICCHASPGVFMGEYTCLQYRINELVQFLVNDWLRQTLRFLKNKQKHTVAGLHSCHVCEAKIHTS